MVYKILIFKADNLPTLIQDTQNKLKPKGYFKSAHSRQGMNIACLLCAANYLLLFTLLFTGKIPIPQMEHLPASAIPFTGLIEHLSRFIT
jgi:hypothetical protein